MSDWISIKILNFPYRTPSYFRFWLGVHKSIKIHHFPIIFHHDWNWWTIITWKSHFQSKSSYSEVTSLSAGTSYKSSRNFTRFSRTKKSETTDIMWVDRPSGVDENLLIERSIPPIKNLSGRFREIQQNPHEYRFQGRCTKNQRSL